MGLKKIRVRGRTAIDDGWWSESRRFYLYGIQMKASFDLISIRFYNKLIFSKSLLWKVKVEIFEKYASLVENSQVVGTFAVYTKVWQRSLCTLVAVHSSNSTKKLEEPFATKLVYQSSCLFFYVCLTRLMNSLNLEKTGVMFC